MIRRPFPLPAFVLATGLLLGACAADGAATSPASSVAGAGEVAAEAPLPPQSWSTFGFDQANSRFNRDEHVITPDNVAGLAKVWEVTGVSGVASTPSVVDGVVYFGAWDNKVHAVDAATGDERWATEMPKVVVGGVMSSITVVDDAVYAAISGKLVKLDREDGGIEWESVVTDHAIAIAPGSPIVVDDLVLQGVASGELMIPVEDYRFKGLISAYDVTSGEKRWTVEFTPDTAEGGGAGVGVWSTPSIDKARKLLFIGTGNTYEPPAASLSDSVVAIRYETGDIAWSRQFTYPDVWSTGNAGGVDGDVGAGPNLWEIDGRAMVGAGDKRGMYHALDRATGEVVWETQMTPGSLLGGVIGTSAVGEGRIYVGSNIGDPASNGPTGKTKLVALDAADGHELWSTEMEGAQYAPITTTPGLVFAASTSGTMAVFSAVDGKQLWSFEAPDQVGSGASVVDGTVYWGYGFSLLGTGSGEGGLYAFRPSASGETASSAAPGGGQPAPDAPGAQLYRTSCASCHGLRGQGGTGPELRTVEDRLTFEEHLLTVSNGKGTQMPQFSKTLSADEIRQIVEYERTHL